MSSPPVEGIFHGYTESWFKALCCARELPGLKYPPFKIVTLVGFLDLLQGNILVLCVLSG